MKHIFPLKHKTPTKISAPRPRSVLFERFLTDTGCEWVFMTVPPSYRITIPGTLLIGERRFFITCYLEELLYLTGELESTELVWKYVEYTNPLKSVVAVAGNLLSLERIPLIIEQLGAGGIYSSLMKWRFETYDGCVGSIIR